MSKQQREFLDHLESNLGVVDIALKKIGIDRDTYSEWLNNIWFKREVDHINERSIDYVENKLLQQIKEGNTNAITFYLKTKGKKRGYK